MTSRRSSSAKVPGFYLLNFRTEYNLKSKNNLGVSSIFFLEGRNLLDENYETGGLYAENEVNPSELVLRWMGLVALLDA